MKNTWLKSLFEEFTLASNGDEDDAHQCDDELIFLIHGNLYRKDYDLGNNIGAKPFGHNQANTALKAEFDRLYSLAYY